jgi:hypothetical protein
MDRIHELDASSRHFVVNHTFIDVIEQEETSPRLALRRWKRVRTSPDLPGDLALLNCGAEEEEDEASLSCGTNEGEDEVRGLASTGSDTESDTGLAGSPLLCFAHIKTSNSWDDVPIVTRNSDGQGYASPNSQSPIKITIEPDAEENGNESARLALENARLANENARLALENENARLALENELLRKQFMKSQGLQSNGCGSVQKSNGNVDNGLDQQALMMPSPMMPFQFMMPSPMMAYIPQAAQTMTEEGNGRTTVMLRNLPNNYTRAMFLSMLDSEGFNGAYDFVYLPIDFCSRACLGYAFVNLVDVSIVPNFWRTFDGYSKWTLPSRKVCSVSWSGPHQGLEAHVERYRNSPVMHTSVPDEYKPVIFRDGTRVVFPTATKSFRAPRIRNSAKNGCHGSRTDFARAPRAAGQRCL